MKNGEWLARRARSVMMQRGNSEEGRSERCRWDCRGSLRPGGMDRRRRSSPSHVPSELLRDKGLSRLIPQQPRPLPYLPRNARANTPVDKAWTQGFFPGLLWLTLERERLIKGSLPWPYTTDDLESMAREWQASFRKHARTAINHDQGFRFASSYGRELKLTGNEECKTVLIEAAESLWDRYDPKVSRLGCKRSCNLLPMRQLPVRGASSSY